MTDSRRTQLEEQFVDASLSLLLDECAEKQGAKWLEAYEHSGISMPGELDKACTALIEKKQRSSQKEFLLRRTAGRAAKAAAIGIACLFICGNLILSVEALRVPLLNFCIDARRSFSSLTFQAEDPSDPADGAVSLPITVPSGYRLSVKDHNHEDDALIHEDSNLFLAYQDDEGHVLMIQTLPAKGSLSIDTENAEASRFLLNGMQAIHIQKEEDHMLRTIWIDPERQRLFDVSCNGLPDEAFEQYIYELAAMLMAPELYAE